MSKLRGRICASGPPISSNATGQSASLLYLVVRVRCHHKESSRSLSHLLMSFLLLIVCVHFCQHFIINETRKKI